MRLYVETWTSKSIDEISTGLSHNSTCLLLIFSASLLPSCLSSCLISRLKQSVWLWSLHFLLRTLSHHVLFFHALLVRHSGEIPIVKMLVARMASCRVMRACRSPLQFELMCENGFNSLVFFFSSSIPDGVQVPLWGGERRSDWETVCSCCPEVHHQTSSNRFLVLLLTVFISDGLATDKCGWF